MAAPEWTLGRFVGRASPRATRIRPLFRQLCCRNDRSNKMKKRRPRGLRFRLLTNPLFFRGFVLSEALSDDRKRLIAA